MCVDIETERSTDVFISVDESQIFETSKILTFSQEQQFLPDNNEFNCPSPVVQLPKGKKTKKFIIKTLELMKHLKF